MNFWEWIPPLMFCGSNHFGGPVQLSTLLLFIVQRVHHFWAVELVQEHLSWCHLLVIRSLLFYNQCISGIATEDPLACAF